MAQIDEVLDRLDFQKKKLGEARSSMVTTLNAESIGKVVYELLDTMQQLAGIVKEHLDHRHFMREAGGSSETF